ncbi:hypothetical protein CRENBAI_004083 [Crenichthys baileyi]|uniref:Uncharacterized protein n=1 Tax=Crenichthys baileyi TaxID=28760 RepID=A0AAV9SD20_9TELE
MVNDSLSLPQSEDRSGSARFDYHITSRSTCHACTPPNAFHRSEESARAARWSVSLSFRGLRNSPQNHHPHPQVSDESPTL